MDYEFTLKFQLADDDCNHDELVERLGAAGCDDALLGIGQPGRIGLQFTRDAASANDALTSAVMDVRRAVPTARLIEAAPDFVGLTEAADMMGMTRQNLRKLMVSNPSFPLPVHEGSAGVWHLSDILGWLHAKGYAVERNVAQVALVTRELNATVEAAQMARGRQHELAQLVA